MDTGIELRIKDLCREKGIGISELADKIGMSRVSIGNFIARRQWPSSEAIRKIADALGVEVSELFAPRRNTFTCPNCGAEISVTLQSGK
ncbi:MAG: helix-turn-helix transcriptional regulator [Bacteroidales bacterium]|nr:helix-turn-helix transcriptional regulator [Bacteroidales bacterium]MBQ6178926.1 helix-turn-helix transcriptional regulator [Bacteroidales bacterium]